VTESTSHIYFRQHENLLGDEVVIQATNISIKKNKQQNKMGVQLTEAESKSNRNSFKTISPPSLLPKTGELANYLCSCCSKSRTHFLIFFPFRGYISCYVRKNMFFYGTATKEMIIKSSAAMLKGKKTSTTVYPVSHSII